MWFDHINYAVEDLYRSHDGKRDVNAFKPGMHVRPGLVKGVVIILGGIQIDSQKSQTAGTRKHMKVKTIRKESCLAVNDPQGDSE